jgi:hypothetical protein
MFNMYLANTTIADVGFFIGLILVNLCVVFLYVAPIYVIILFTADYFHFKKTKQHYKKCEEIFAIFDELSL